MMSETATVRRRPRRRLGRVQLTSATADVEIQYRVGAAAGLHLAAELTGTLSPTPSGAASSARRRSPSAPARSSCAIQPADR